MRQTFQDFLSLCAEQQSQIDWACQALEKKVDFQELSAELANKADVQDVSNAITEIVVSTDTRKELESLKMKVNEYRQELDEDQNKHTKKIFEGFKQET